MLSQILRQLDNAEGPLDLNGLARRLEVQPSALEDMIQFLVRKGHLREIECEDAAACAACPLRSTCGPTLGTRLWELTEKGRQRLAREDAAPS